MTPRALTPGLTRAQSTATFAVVYALVIAGLLIAIFTPNQWVPTGSKDPLVLWQRLVAMGVAIAIAVGLSYVPQLIYATFTRKELERLKSDWQQELQSHSWTDLAARVAEVLERRYDFERYTFPLLLTFCSALLGWWLVIFSGGLQAATDLVANGRINEFLGHIMNAHPVAIGFIGAYIFSLGLLVRGYLRGDLSPSLLMLVSYRIWEVMLAALVVTGVWALASELLKPGSAQLSAGDLLDVFQLEKFPADQRPALMAAVFLAGFASPSSLYTMLANIAGLAKDQLLLKVPEEYKLKNLDGINTYVEARLMEAGIENVQNLAMADIADTIVSARLGSVRIVDWIDQALIRLPAEKHTSLLRAAGIRTATDLYIACYGAGPQGEDMSTPKVPDGIAVLAKTIAQLEVTAAQQAEQAALAAAGKGRSAGNGRPANTGDSSPASAQGGGSAIWCARIEAWARSISNHPNFVLIRTLRDEARQTASVLIPLEHRLANIDGMNSLLQRRLDLSAIVDIPSLAAADVKDVVANCKLPESQVRDWVDQALLHLPAGRYMHEFRIFGIRTATNFVSLYIHFADYRNAFEEYRRQERNDRKQEAPDPDPGAEVVLSLIRRLVRVTVQREAPESDEADIADTWLRRLDAWAESITQHPKFQEISAGLPAVSEQVRQVVASPPPLV